MNQAAVVGEPEHRAVCVVSDADLRRTLRRTLHAAGTQVEFRDRLGGDDETSRAPASLLFLDAAARRDASVREILQIVGAEGWVVILGDSISDDEVVSLLRHRRLNHVIHDVGEADEGEIVVTSAKLLSGDIFGLEKYLSWGVSVQELPVADYDQKRDAIEQLVESARGVGARRPVCAKIENVADELLMNAIYDAPTVDGSGARGPTAGGGTTPALLRYACDGRYFAVSVRDEYGALRKEAILDNLLRARDERGRPRASGDGAGLGLYFVLSSVTRFIANVQPGERTEVICLFDLRVSPRDAGSCAQSLHIFTI